MVLRKVRSFEVGAQRTSRTRDGEIAYLCSPPIESIPPGQREDPYHYYSSKK